jgi:hypothetical protein
MTEDILERAHKIKDEIKDLKKLYNNIQDSWHAFVFDKDWNEANIHEFLKLLTDTKDISVALLRELRWQRLENIQAEINKLQKEFESL